MAKCVNALSGLYLIVTWIELLTRYTYRISVNALSGLYLIVTLLRTIVHSRSGRLVSMPSRACTSLLQGGSGSPEGVLYGVSMPSRACTSLLHRDIAAMNSYLVSCQCPLGLVPHCYTKVLHAKRESLESVNALSGLYLIVTVPLQKPRFYAVSRACFCRYLSEYSDSNSFSCMLTIWTYLMR